MTLRTKWTLAICATLAAGMLLQLALSTNIIFYGADKSGDSWVRQSWDNAVHDRRRAQFARLDSAAGILSALPGLDDAVGRGDEAAVRKFLAIDTPAPSELWAVVTKDGAVLASSSPACNADLPGQLSDARAAAKTGIVELRLVCGRWPGLGAAHRLSSSQGWLVTARVLEQSDLDVLQGAVATEIVLLGEDGTVLGTSFRDKQKQLENPPFSPEQLRAFSSDTLACGKGTVPLTNYPPFLMETVLPDLVLTNPNAYWCAGPMFPERATAFHLAVVVPDTVLTYGPIIGVKATAAGALLLLIAVLVLTASQIKRFTKPLVALADGARRLGAGDLGHRVALPKEEELRVTCLAFNKMADDLQRTQDRLLQSGKMAAIGQLAAGVAHEVNNPLAVILGFAEGIEVDLAKDDPLREPIEAIIRQARRTRTLVSELLAFSRTGKRETKPVSLNEIVAETMPMIEARARTAEVTVTTDLATDLPAVAANANHLQQVVLNLANNACDAMKPGGKLTIQTTQSGGQVALVVKDDGAGIPEDVKAHIFEPFFTTKAVGQGTGLGLSLVYEIVHAHNGVIDVDSAENAGTTMTVRLPVAAPA